MPALFVPRICCMDHPSLCGTQSQSVGNCDRPGEKDPSNISCGEIVRWLEQFYNPRRGSARECWHHSYPKRPRLLQSQSIQVGTCHKAMGKSHVLQDTCRALSDCWSLTKSFCCTNFESFCHQQWDLSQHSDMPVRCFVVMFEYLLPRITDKGRLCCSDPTLIAVPFAPVFILYISLGSRLRHSFARWTFYLRS